ncbi:hypothetical protein [Halostagnicola sp. A-GB9-2]|uniref:hypothetical protein n=1 Tax=Halostagnicola sp. A-GB9-2 TaxID=3048066 RepID=UPI0024C0CFA5|nr:hypothetical protein [Halostagnicola sp. A-GB9-2]MDJ1432990.1 hypothetical protein [Halostagnicola sp. A-GB9-2]
MSGETAASADSRASNHPRELTRASIALMVAGIPFYIGGLLVIQTDTPPSLSPTLGILSHALWALAVAILALGVAILLRWIEPLR